MLKGFKATTLSLFFDFSIMIDHYYFINNEFINLLGYLMLLFTYFV